jgi:hypothetical protein
MLLPCYTLKLYTRQNAKENNNTTVIVNTLLEIKLLVSFHSDTIGYEGARVAQWA